MTDRARLTCRELTEFLLLYLDGELSPERTADFERHLSVCAACVKYLSTYKKTIALGKAACGDPNGPVGVEVPRQLVEAILSARRREK
jgi:anti-sigma factor RsiW